MQPERRRIPTAVIDKLLLDMLFEEFAIWEKIQDGRLTSEPLPKSARPSTSWPGSFSQIIKHRLPNGKHVVTTHRVVAPDGIIHHQDAKGIRLRDVRLWRR